VFPVLFLCNLCSALIWLTLMSVQSLHPGALPSNFAVAPLTGHQHLLLFAKSAMIAVGWVASYFAIKFLPVSIASPIRASGPLWSLVGAVIVLGERPTWLENIGVAITLVSFVGLSLAGRGEGVQFHRNKWVGWLFFGTLIMGLSTLYDKYLLGHLHLTTATVQAWFSIYLALIFFPLAVGWKLRWWPRNEFHWRWSVPMLSIVLLLSDFLYFESLRDPHVLVSLVASIRRGSTIVGFLGGLLFFGEKNGWQKLPAIIGILVGIVLTLLG
jgi:drug/metabolite transporter (DMT)-like permease